MFSCSKVNTILINTTKGRGYVATEINKCGKVLEKISGSHDNPRTVKAFFERMGYPTNNIKLQSELTRDVFGS